MLALPDAVFHVGVFHFGSNHTEPIEAIDASLSDYGRDGVKKALIVLSEDFNTSLADGRDKKALRLIQDVAAKFELAFLAGLILPPWNVAYLIAPGQSVPICRKQSPDGIEEREYTPCDPELNGSEMCDPHNPYKFANEITIGALICRDCYDWTPAATRRKRLEGVDIVCLPFNTYYRDKHHIDVSGIIAQWPGSYVLLANRNPTGVPSFIADRSGKIVQAIPEAESATNKILLEPYEAG